MQNRLSRYFDDEVYKQESEKERKVLIMKDIFNISGQNGKKQFRGAKFLL